MWIGEKFQSNPEIAGSPRNSFRASLDIYNRTSSVVEKKVNGGRALNCLGGVKAYQSISNSECRITDNRESDYTR